MSTLIQSHADASSRSSSPSPGKQPVSSSLDGFAEKKRNILEAYQQANLMFERLSCVDYVEPLQVFEQQLREGLLHVVVCGKYKQGKSQLINALLDEPALLPTDADIATAALTVIQYGEQERIRVVLRQNDDERMIDIGREELNQYVSHQADAKNASHTRLVVIQIPSPLLREGLVLVDTPGVEGVNRAHTDLTYSYLERADAVLYVSDVHQPLTERDLDFVGRIANQDCEIVHVITKSDAADVEEIVDSNTEKLGHALQTAPDNVPVLCVSSNDKLRYLETADMLDLRDSGFHELQEQIGQSITRRSGDIILRQATDRLQRTLLDRRQCQEAKLAVLKAESEEDAEAIRQELEQAKNRFTELQGESAHWCETISVRMDEILVGLRRQLRQEFQSVERQARQDLEKMTSNDAPDELIGGVHGQLVAVVSRLSRTMGERIDGLHGEIADLIGVPLDPFRRPGQIPHTPDVDRTSCEVDSASLWDKTVTYGRDLGIWAMGGSVIGGIAGTVIGCGVGLVSGGIAVAPGAYYGAQWGAQLGGVLTGATVGRDRAMKTLQSQQRAARCKTLDPVIKEMIMDTRAASQDYIEDVCRNWKHHVRSQLRLQIECERERCQSLIESLQVSNRMNHSQRQEQIAVVSRELVEISELLKRIENSCSNGHSDHCQQDSSGDEQVAEVPGWLDG